MQNLPDLRSMTQSEIENFVLELGFPKYRARQIFIWVQSGAESFDEMSNIPKSMREILLQKCYISVAKIEKKFVSEYDGTIKYLFMLSDGELIESVLMKYNHGYSICISTQVGCRMGCSFCATGLGGLSRNLTAGEMLAQIMSAQRDNNIRISNVVLMGMGEPLDNFANVMRFFELVGCEDGLCIGMRHISLSTCGLVDKIRELAQLNMQFTLSVSLHAPNDKIRTDMMPINKKWNVDSLLSACREYAQQTRRRISFEYSLISGVNDTPECARELAAKLKGMLCHVNLIPVNTVKESGYVRSNQKQISQFQEILTSRGITTTVRRTLGSDIDASCGQLRRRHIDAQ